MSNPLPRRHSNSWWLRRPSYFIFMMREWSAVFVAIYAVLLLILTSKVLEGEAAYQSFVDDVLAAPAMIAFHAVALAFALLHTITWFMAVPKGLPLRRGEDLVPPMLIVGGAYASWIGVSIIVAALFLLD
ncbi:MAG TPA: fumarate reductase subunit C [Dehalococcoidia bacterium]|nr:fumarate reductase subunit C [Dehalococcoidia bacterium]